MIKIELMITNKAEADIAAAAMAAIAAAFAGGSPLEAVAVTLHGQRAEPTPAAPTVEPEARTRRSRKPADPAAAYEAATGVKLDDPAPADTIENEVAAVEAAAVAEQPAGPAEQPAGPAVTLDMVRPLIREKGVLWGREALARYKVLSGFGAMTPEQLAALYAELTAGQVAA